MPGHKERKTKMVHIVVDCRMINASGIGTYIRNILPGIVTSNIFFVTVMGRRNELEEFEWYPNVTFVELKSKILSMTEQFELPLKIPRCDIYWAPNINGAIFFTKAKVRVTTIHDVYHLAHRKLFSSFRLRLFELMIRAGIFHSKFIITVSNFSKSEIIAYTGCPPHKIKVCPEAVEDTFNNGFVPKKIKERYILFVGNVKPHKNLYLALKAFTELDYPKLKFFIVGKKEGFITGHPELFEAVEGLEDRVVFTGHVGDSELKNFYANASLFLFPSKYEGFGLPVLEAMKFNLPILAARAAAIPEVGGDVIEYFDPESLEDLKLKLKLVLSNDFKVPEERYELQLKKFSWEKAQKDHIEILMSARNQ